jgi:hypothetical protein
MPVIALKEFIADIFPLPAKTKTNNANQTNQSRQGFIVRFLWLGLILDKGFRRKFFFF